MTRHSAASYWLALKHDSEYVAEQLGNSVRILKRDYKALITREQAARFYGELASTTSSRSNTADAYCTPHSSASSLATPPA